MQPEVSAFPCPAEVRRTTDNSPQFQLRVCARYGAKSQRDGRPASSAFRINQPSTLIHQLSPINFPQNLASPPSRLRKLACPERAIDISRGSPPGGHPRKRPPKNLLSFAGHPPAGGRQKRAFPLPFSIHHHRFCSPVPPRPETPDPRSFPCHQPSTLIHQLPAKPHLDPFTPAQTDLP